MKVYSHQSSWLDHLLMAICAMLAVYAAALGINKPNIGMFFAAGIAGCTFVAFGLGRLLAGSRLFRLDGVLYLAAAIFVVFRAVPLNRLLPDEGYPMQLILAGVLSWMLLVGSLVAWRDTTQVFQMVPCIALFGLVGAWNTYETAQYLFFVFLACAATLFARSHLRAMLRQAEIAEGPAETGGVKFLQTGEPEPDPRDVDTERLAGLRTGPWRWMAGPEWALVSALGVVLFSLVGAPVIQSSVSAVSGQIRVNVPLPRPPTSTAASNFAASDSTLRVGAGPRGQTEGRPVLRARLDRQRYLRSSTFYRFSGSAWSNDITRELFANAQPYLDEEYASLKNQRMIEFDVEYLVGRHDRIYVPGMPVRVPADRRQRPFPISVDGMVSNSLGEAPPFRLSGISLVPTEAAHPVKAIEPPYLAGRMTDDSTVRPRVREFARKAIEGAETDYERAMAIKAAIESQVRYNLDAPAIPTDVDAVEAFLFETREGYCDLFASAMAMCARAVGIPSRTAIGFWPNDAARDAQGYMTVKDSDYHMWCEIYFEGVGWLPFDPTEGAPAVEGAGRGAVKEATTPWFEQDWVRQAIDFLLVAMGVAVILLAVRGLFTKKPAKVVPERTAVGRLYARFGRSLEKLTGKPRRLNETPREYIERIADQLPDPDRASALTARFEAALYAPEAPTPQDLKDLGGEVDDFRKTKPVPK
jgi:transglutaminase-like putative cysteine protease